MSSVQVRRFMAVQRRVPVEDAQGVQALVQPVVGGLQRRTHLPQALRLGRAREPARRTNADNLFLKGPLPQVVDAIRKNEAGELVVEVKASGPPAIDGIGPTERIDEYWKESDETRRKRSAWAA